VNTAATKGTLLKRIEGINKIPSIPVVLAPLLRYLQQPVEDFDVQKLTAMIAQDNPLAAQCLQMTNNPLFGRWQKVDSLRAAVMGLGFHRIATSPCHAAYST
jgi:HD-like signal output (HDOD) protein